MRILIQSEEPPGTQKQRESCECVDVREDAFPSQMQIGASETLLSQHWRSAPDGVVSLLSGCTTAADAFVRE